MKAHDYAGQQGMRVHRTSSSGKKEGSGAETLFGMVLALTAMYGIGSVLAFLATYLVR